MFSFNNGVLKLTHVDSRARVSRSHLALGLSKLVGLCLDRVVLKMRIDKKTSACLVCVISCVKIDSIDMLKFTQTQV